jgi:hypothetical protein
VCHNNQRAIYDRIINWKELKQEVLLAFHFGFIICNMHLPKSVWLMLLVLELRRPFHPSHSQVNRFRLGVAKGIDS